MLDDRRAVWPVIWTSRYWKTSGKGGPSCRQGGRPSRRREVASQGLLQAVDAKARAVTGKTARFI